MAMLNYTSSMGDSMVYHQSMFLKKLSTRYGRKKGWREKLGEFLESKPEQIFMFSLIILDLLVVIVQLFVVAPTIKCDDKNPDVEEPEAYEIADKVLDDISLAILSILALEMVLLLIAFDKDFFKQPLYVLDALVIGASLTIEIEQNRLSTLFSAGSLLIFFRLWRIVRIVHGVAMSVQEKNEEAIKKLENEIQQLTSKNAHLGAKFDYIKKRYKKLIDATRDELANTPPQMMHNRKLLEDEVAFMNTASASYQPPPSLPNSQPSVPPSHAYLTVAAAQSPPAYHQSSPFKSPGAPHYYAPPPPQSAAVIQINDNDNNDNNNDVGKYVREDTSFHSFAASPQTSKDYRTFDR